GLLLLVSRFENDAYFRSERWNTFRPGLESEFRVILATFDRDIQKRVLEVGHADYIPAIGCIDWRPSLIDRVGIENAADKDPSRLKLCLVLNVAHPTLRPDVNCLSAFFIFEVNGNLRSGCSPILRLIPNR